MSIAESRNGHNNILFWIFTITICAGLYLTIHVNYLLFHILVELFSIIVAATIFVITWNSVKYIKNPYLIMVGVSYLFVGILDLLHTLSYKGMPIFTDYDFYANELWIAARGLESCSLLAAFLLLFSNKTVKAGFICIIYSLITTLLIASIFYWKIFPICFVAGKGLTAFKVYSEYAICAILVTSIVLLIRNRGLFAESVYKLLLLSMVFTIISELAFTFYINNYGFSNIVGHYFKLFSFMMIYRAIVATGIEEPYHLIFNELNRTNEDLQKEINSRIQTEIKLESEIDERKRTEVALRESEFFFKESQRAASIGSYKTDFITGRWESSEKLDTIFGIDSEYTRNVQGWLDIVHPDERNMMDQYLREEVTAKKNLFSKEYRIIRKNDGETRWVHGLGEVTYDRNDIPTSMIGTIQDITARIQTLDSLRLSEERHRVLAETMLQGVVHQDVNGKIISINPAAELILGKSREEFLDYSSVDEGYDTIRENGEHFPGMEHPTMVALRTGLPVSGVVMGVFNPKLKEYRWLGIDAVPVFSPGEDRPSEVYSIFGDITERNQAEKALQKAHDELERRVTERTLELSATIDRLQSEIFERKLAEKKLLEETTVRLKATEALREKERMLIQQNRQAAMGEMIGNIAHQWRQPLNTLGLYTQSIGAFYGMPNFNKEFLDNSIAKTMEIIKHMSKTIDDFRDYFKPEKEKADFYVMETIKNTLSLLEGNFNNPNITIDFVEHYNPVINGYQNEFAQVFLNIMNNARDAIIEREIADARVTITICSEDNCAVVTVADNAGGIPDEVINKVFDPYFTTKGPQVGTGIGLFMSKTIIEKNMGGRLTVRNTDTGAEFRIEVEHGT